MRFCGHPFLGRYITIHVQDTSLGRTSESNPVPRVDMRRTQPAKVARGCVYYAAPRDW